MSFIGEVHVFVDGGCRGNPGPGAIGVVIRDGGTNKPLEEHRECIGTTTNNRAEYRALIKGLDLCARHTRKRVVCFSDSELLVNQMDGVWRLKDGELRKLWHEARKNAGAFDEVVYQRVDRKNPGITRADRLLNQAFEGR